MTRVCVELPLRLDSVANLREHYMARARRTKVHRMTARYLTAAHSLPCVVTITRIAPRPLDTDNLASSAKGVRDGIADRLGIKDNDPRVEWRYKQAKSARPKYYGCMVEIDAA